MSWQSVTSPRLSTANERALNSTNWVYTDTRASSSLPRKSTITTYLPFQVIIASETLLKAEAGVLGNVNINSPEEEDPADGTWRLFAKVIINSSTGAITSSTVEWVNGDVPADTTTNYHREIARVILVDGVANPADSIQYTYGPISVVVGGGRDSRYAARLL
jgi:hypothetical protein